MIYLIREGRDYFRIFVHRALHSPASGDSPNATVNIELANRIASKAAGWMSMIHWIIEKQQPPAN